MSKELTEEQRRDLFTAFASFRVLALAQAITFEGFVKEMMKDAPEGCTMELAIERTLKLEELTGLRLQREGKY